ncbi:hypothetical protein FOA52_015457 [Chlamydomonas sp. UWO 241]|nr:hypothetical protein FOA52_015457 [Chlamydomonas sp. UWO 241]
MYACMRAQVQLMRQLLQPQAASSSAGPSWSAGSNGTISVSQLLHSFPATMLPGSTHVGVFKVTNSSGAQQTLLSVCLLQPVDGVVLSDSGGRQRGVTSMPPVLKTLAHGAVWTVTVTVSPRFIGYIKGLVVFMVAGRNTVVRAIDATCVIAAEPGMPGVAPAEKPYVRPELRRAAAEAVPQDVVPAPRDAKGGGGAELPVKMGYHDVPDYLRKVAAAGKLEALAKMLSRSGPAKSAAEYARRLQELLWAEELQLEVDIQGYDMSGVEMEQSGKYLKLDVPGLAENRPCVMTGDKLHAWQQKSGKMNAGRVVNVTREQVLLLFREDFHKGHVRGMRYNVRFIINRSVLRLMHGALERAGRMLPPLALCPGALFAPLPVPLASPLSLNGVTAAATQLPWVNNRLNILQQTAVVEVLRGAAGSIPYYLFGPPGTGKTMTIIEAVVQLLLQAQGPVAPGGRGGVHTAPRPSLASTFMAFMGVGQGAAPAPKVRVVPASADAAVPAPKARVVPPPGDAAAPAPKARVVPPPGDAAAPAPKARVVPPPGGAAPSTPSSHPLGGKPSSSSAPASASASVRVLLCAPSSSAADLLAQRLLKQGGRPPSEVLRVMAFSRSADDVPAELRGVTNEDASGQFPFPQLSTLTAPHVRVAVCTLSLASKLVNAGVTPGYFSHVFVDEAGHMEEPMQLCALAGLAVGGIGVEPCAGGVLRVLFTVASDAVADVVVRYRCCLSFYVDSSAAVFDVLSDPEEAQHQALWPAFVAAKAAGKRAQFHRARLVVDGERVAAPAC